MNILDSIVSAVAVFFVAVITFLVGRHVGATAVAGVGMTLCLGLSYAFGKMKEGAKFDTKTFICHCIGGAVATFLACMVSVG